MAWAKRGPIKTFDSMFELGTIYFNFGRTREEAFLRLATELDGLEADRWSSLAWCWRAVRQWWKTQRGNAIVRRWRLRREAR